MSKRNHDFISIQQGLQEMLSESNLEKGITALEVKSAWGAVMGPGVLAYTSEIAFKNKVLLVKLSSAALREELSYGKQRIVMMLNEYLEKETINNIKLT